MWLAVCEKCAWVNKNKYTWLRNSFSCSRGLRAGQCRCGLNVLGFTLFYLLLDCVSHLVIIFKASAVGEWYWCENDVTAWKIQRGFSNPYSFKYISPTGRGLDWMTSCVSLASAFCGSVSDRAGQEIYRSLLTAAERLNIPAHPRWGWMGACGTSLQRSLLNTVRLLISLLLLVPQENMTLTSEDDTF